MEIPMISMRELLWRISRGEAMALLDLRSPEEYEKGHLMGAENFPYETLIEEMADLDGLPRDRPVYLYCAGGSLSLLACRFLRERGYPAVSAAGGLRAYRGPLYSGRTGENG